MSIDLRSIGPLPKASPSKQSSARATRKSVTARPSATGGPDAVHFTDASSILQNAERLVSTLPVVEVGRVSGITSSIDQGSYIVDAERVAEKIIKFEQGLTG